MTGVQTCALPIFLMEQVVPWVPYMFTLWTTVVSDRVVTSSFRFDQFAALPAIDRIALEAGGA